MPINTFFSDDDFTPKNNNTTDDFFGADNDTNEEDIFSSFDNMDDFNAENHPLEEQATESAPDTSDVGSSVFESVLGEQNIETDTKPVEATATSQPSDDTVQFDINDFSAMSLFDTATDIDVNSAMEQQSAEVEAPKAEETEASAADEMPDVPSFMDNAEKAEAPKPVLFDFDKEFSEIDSATNNDTQLSSGPSPVDIPAVDDELYAKPVEQNNDEFDFAAFERENFTSDVAPVEQPEQVQPEEAAAPVAEPEQPEQPQENINDYSMPYESKRQYKPVFAGPISNPVTETKEARVKAAAAKKAAAAAALAGLEAPIESSNEVQPTEPEAVQTEQPIAEQYGVPVLESPTDTPITAPVTEETVQPQTIENTDVYPAGSDNFAFTGENFDTSSMFDATQPTNDSGVYDAQQNYTDYSVQNLFDTDDNNTVANVAAGVADAMGVTNGSYVTEQGDYSTNGFNEDTSATRVFDTNDVNNYQHDIYSQPQDDMQFDANAYGDVQQTTQNDMQFDKTEYGNTGFETMNFDSTATVDTTGYGEADNNDYYSQQAEYIDGGADETDSGDYQQQAPSFNPFESNEWTGDEAENEDDLEAPAERTLHSYADAESDLHDYSRSRSTTKKSGKGKKSNTPLIILLAVLIIAIIGILAYALLGGRGGAASSSVASISQSIATEPVSSVASESVPAESVPTEPAVQPIPRDAWYMVLANANNLLSADFAVTTASTNYGAEVDSRIVNAVNSMLDAAKNEGVNLSVHTGFRSYSKQQSLYASNPSTTAPAGGSDYNTGLSVGLFATGGSKYDENFDNTTAGQWLTAHAAEFGFIQRYPVNGQDSTGISYMPWQYRYVGVVEAQRIKESGLTLEQYLAQSNESGTPSNENPDDGSALTTSAEEAAEPQASADTTQESAETAPAAG